MTRGVLCIVFVSNVCGRQRPLPPAQNTHPLNLEYPNGTEDPKGPNALNTVYTLILLLRVFSMVIGDRIFCTFCGPTFLKSLLLIHLDSSQMVLDIS